MHEMRGRYGALHVLQGFMRTFSAYFMQNTCLSSFLFRFIAERVVQECVLKPIYYLAGIVPAVIVVGVLLAVKPDALTLPIYIGIGVGAGAIVAIVSQIYGKKD